jgi:hypothetical protein
MNREVVETNGKKKIIDGDANDVVLDRMEAREYDF